MFTKKRAVVLQNRFTRSVLEIEFEHQEIQFEAQKKLKLIYRGKELKQTFKPDFICYEKL